MSKNTLTLLTAYVIFSTMVAYDLSGRAFAQIGTALLLLPVITFFVRSKFYFYNIDAFVLALVISLSGLSFFYSSQGDERTFVSIFAMIWCLACISIIAMQFRNSGSAALKGFINVCEVMFYVILGVSILGTAIHLPWFPTEFPWSAISGDKRLILLTSAPTGQSASLWINAFALISRIDKIMRGKKSPYNVPLLLLLIATLLLSKSRLALIMMLLFGILIGLKALKMKTERANKIVLGASWVYLVLYFLLQFNPAFQDQVFITMTLLQAQVPALRIVAYRPANNTTSLFTGRDNLNRQLLDLIQKQPLIGVGNDFEGVNLSSATGVQNQNSGGGGSESPLRLVAKFGVIVSVFYLLFLLRTSYLSTKSEGSLATMSMIIIVVTVASEATFELMFGIGGFFFFACLLILNEHSKNRVQALQPAGRALQRSGVSA